jgi:hypothetical protein
MRPPPRKDAHDIRHDIRRHLHARHHARTPRMASIDRDAFVAMIEHL